MLPDGFQWDDSDASSRLRLMGDAVAMTQALPDGTCQSITHLSSYTRSQRLWRDADLARRYCEAWATKWQDCIRPEVANRVRRNELEAQRQSTRPTPAEYAEIQARDHARRTGRKWPPKSREPQPGQQL